MQDVLTIGVSATNIRPIRLGVVCADTIGRICKKVGLKIFGTLSKMFLNLKMTHKRIDPINLSLGQKTIFIGKLSERGQKIAGFICANGKVRLAQQIQIITKIKTLKNFMGLS